jgi:hypothetical protein
MGSGSEHVDATADRGCGQEGAAIRATGHAIVPDAAVFATGAHDQADGRASDAALRLGASGTKSVEGGSPPVSNGDQVNRVAVLSRPITR